MSYFDDNDNSPAADLWGERVNGYMDGQEGVEALRSRVQPNPPWPEADNAITWVAGHAWFESALDTRAELIRHLGA